MRSLCTIVAMKMAKIITLNIRKNLLYPRSSRTTPPIVRPTTFHVLMRIFIGAADAFESISPRRSFSA